MITIKTPENANYDEFVVRTVTNLNIKRLCIENDTIEDLQQAYDIVERKSYIHPTNAEFRIINSLENKYRASILILASIYEEFYQSIAERALSKFANKTFKDFYKQLLNELSAMMIAKGIHVN